MSTYDPVTTASTLATAYTQAAQSRLTAQTGAVSTTSSALGKLQTALTSFDSALGALSSKKGVLSNSATLGNTAFGSATATGAAAAGSYALYVDQLASAHQVMFTELPAIPVPVTGKLSITVSGANFDVDFSTADFDGNGTLSQSEIARAINQANGNQGKLSASLVTTGSGSQLVLTAAETGAASQIALDASDLAGNAGNAAAVDAFKSAVAGGGTQLVAAQDAIVYVGTRSDATRVTQASNTYAGIAGVSVSFTKAMAPTDEPITLTVARDSSATAANVKSFVDAYNSLKGVLDELTRSGNGSTGASAGAFATDGGIRSLRNRHDSLLREAHDGFRLADFGVTADRNGALTLDTAKLDRKLAVSPDGLDRLFGNSSLTNSSGLLGSLGKYVDLWTDTTSGQIKSRRESVQKRQDALTRQQERLDLQYENAYQRYLAQFSVLANLESQMSSTTSMFANLNLFSTQSS